MLVHSRQWFGSEFSVELRKYFRAVPRALELVPPDELEVSNSVSKVDFRIACNRRVHFATLCT
jgi:hypothetical protein